MNWKQKAQLEKDAERNAAFYAEEEMKHTPGPWEAESESIEHDGEYREPTVWAVGKNGFRVHVAIVRIGLPGSHANARLIAASPCLLEACKAALRVIDCYERDTEEIKMLKAAISKAEGQ